MLRITDPHDGVQVEKSRKRHWTATASSPVIYSQSRSISPSQERLHPHLHSVLLVHLSLLDPQVPARLGSVGENY
jgi:hypothetical protein